MKRTYKEFVWFSAGSLGDHAIELDHANRFFESTGIPSVIIYKNNYAFLKDLANPYLDHISRINFSSFQGRLATVYLLLSSVLQRRCYILWMPIRYPFYMRLFAYFIRFCTLSRFVGLDVDYKSPYGDFSKKSSLFFLGKKNIVPLNSHTELFYEQANRFLQFLGFKEVLRKPCIVHEDKKYVLEKFNIVSGQYLAIHVMSSAPDRSFPLRRWSSLLKKIHNAHPGLVLVFTGSKKDGEFIVNAIKEIPKSSVRVIAGETSMQEMLTVYARAACCFTIHTGNAMLINMLQVKAVVANMVGNYMFQYHFNDKATVLFEKKRCTCCKESIECFVQEDGRKYAKCMYDITDDQIVNALAKRLG